MRETLQKIVVVRDAGGCQRRTAEQASRHRDCMGGIRAAGGHPARQDVYLPTGLVHDKDIALCSARYRTLSGYDVVHLANTLVVRARQVVKEARDEARALPGAVLEQYHPTSDCLCCRCDSFFAFLKMNEKRSLQNISERRCAVCSRRGSGIKVV